MLYTRAVYLCACMRVCVCACVRMFAYVSEPVRVCMYIAKRGKLLTVANSFTRSLAAIGYITAARTYPFHRFDLPAFIVCRWNYCAHDLYIYICLLTPGEIILARWKGLPGRLLRDGGDVLRGILLTYSVCACLCVRCDWSRTCVVDRRRRRRFVVSFSEALDAVYTYTHSRTHP